MSIGALLADGLIDESESPWGEFCDQDRIFTSDEIDCGVFEMSKRYPHIDIVDLKKASYANMLYRWYRCGYAHLYCATGNITSMEPSYRKAQISYIGRVLDNQDIMRVSAFHLDYLLEVAEDLVESVPLKPLPKPAVWWIDCVES